jgi:hypothetical protein
MVDIIARSRIGFWTAFMHAGRPHLNVRDPGTLACVTVPLRADEPSVLAGDAEGAHDLARRLAADVGRRANHVLDTPGIQAVEPVTHDWEPRAVLSEPRLMAA